MQAIVLAGGKGERLWPLTTSTPKVMTLLCGKPLIRYHLEWLKKEGITDAVIACGYLAGVIKDYLENNPVDDLSIKFSCEGTLLGRGGASRKAAKYLPYQDRPCVLSQGDIISDMPLAEAYRKHLESVSALNIILTALLIPYRSRYGVIELGSDGLIQRFREKPRLPYWANTGIFIASPEFFNFLPDQGDEDRTIEYLSSKELVGSFCTHFYSRTVDTLKDVHEAEIDLSLPMLPHEEPFYSPTALLPT